MREPATCCGAKRSFYPDLISNLVDVTSASILFSRDSCLCLCEWFRLKDGFKYLGEFHKKRIQVTLYGKVIRNYMLHKKEWSYIIFMKTKHIFPQNSEGI